MVSSLFAYFVSEGELAPWVCMLTLDWELAGLIQALQSAIKDYLSRPAKGTNGR